LCRAERLHKRGRVHALRQLVMMLRSVTWRQDNCAASGNLARSFSWISIRLKYVSASGSEKSMGALRRMQGRALQPVLEVCSRERS